MSDPEDDSSQSDDEADAPTRRHFYGRRHGPGLSLRQQALLDELLPRLRVPYRRDAQDLDPATFFSASVDDVWMEIGFGGGEHLARLALDHPRIGLVGCEPFVNGVAKLLVEAERLALANLRIHDDDALLLIDALAPASLGRIYMLHPDPWPKRRHWKRRFINDRNLDRLARVLKPGGEFRFTSDHAGYVGWTRKHMAQRNDFVLTGEGKGVAEDDLPELPADGEYKVSQTRYGAKAHREGRERVHLLYVKR